MNISGTFVPTPTRSVAAVELDAGQRTVLGVFLICAAAASLLPFHATKVALGAGLALYGFHLLIQRDERFVGIFVLLLPMLQLAPLEALGVTGFNWQTLFMVVFGVMALAASPPVVSSSLTGWMIAFSVILVGSAIHSAASQDFDASDLLAKSKNWLFPFLLYVVGRRCLSTGRQFWFVFWCVALVSLFQSVHALADALTVANLLRHRPKGMLTNQANLFAGYVSIYALLFIFAAQARRLSAATRSLLIVTSFALTVTLVFTLSRGAWIAFAISSIALALMADRRVLIALVLTATIGYRWLPDEAVTRGESTIVAVEGSDNVPLEESVDGSAALRVIQWKTFPTMFAETPLFGSGMNTYAQRLSRATGIYRSAHAMMVEIGVEMGGLGLLAYVGLLGSAFWICLTIAHRSGSRSLRRQLAIGFAAATLCLFVLDFTGTRFRANTVTAYYWLMLGSFVGVVQRQANGAGATDVALLDTR